MLLEHVMTARLSERAPVAHAGVSLWKRVQQALCSLHGHDSLLQLERDRMFLRCASCGYETPGWEVHRSRPAL